MKGYRDKLRKNKYLRWLLLISSWMFQGIINADRTEKVYCLLFTIIFTIIFYFSLSSINDVIIRFFLSFIIAHTLNWLINVNINSILIHRLFLKKLSKSNLFRYLESLDKRLNEKNWLLYSAVFGSICRGTLKDSSDLDVSLVRKPGFIRALKGLFFITCEKKIADFKSIPLEIYLNDLPESSIERFKAEKNPLILKDPSNIISRYYDEYLTLSEAKSLNNIE